MLDYIWAMMIIIGVVYGFMCGRIEVVSNGILDSSKEAVSTCITMLGIMCLWCGVMQVAKDAGIMKKLSRLLEPFIHFLFPNIKGYEKANEYIVTNMVANILGLGWAATPAGLKAMEELAKIEEERYEKGDYADEERNILSREIKRKRKNQMKRGMASDEMCTFLVMNISSLQLIPVNMIAYRSQYGSVNPSAIVLPGIVATIVNSMVAIVYCKMKSSHTKRKRIF